MDAIVLASSSPRRSELLSRTGIPFTVMPSGVDEDNAELHGTYSERVEQLAGMKALDVAKRVDGGIVLGADTIVVCDGIAFGKPADENEARKMLKSLSGREHTVITRIALVNAENGVLIKGHEKTKVEIAQLSAEDIDVYIASGEPFDKAGAYAVQGRGALFVKSIKGCYTNVVGLPLFKLRSMLREIGIDPLSS